MPRPLSEVSPEGRITFGAGALRASPFAADVAYVIARWAHTDGDIATILSRMLKADIAVGTAMYLALVNSGAQRGAFNAAAKEALPTWQYVVLRAIGAVTEPWRETRNHFAHRIWGVCSDVADAVLLTHPKTVVDHNVSFRQRAVELPDGRGVIQPKAIDDTRIYVYRQIDFDNAIRNADRAGEMYRLLYASLADPDAAGPVGQLLKDADVLSRVRQLASQLTDASELDGSPLSTALR